MGDIFETIERQQLQIVECKTPGPICISPTILVQVKTLSDGEIDSVTNMNANKCVEYQVHQLGDETQATTYNIHDTVYVSDYVEWYIYDIILNDQGPIKKELSTWMIQFEAWWKSINVQMLCATSWNSAIQYVYPMMHPAGTTSGLISEVGSNDSFKSENLNGNMPAVWQGDISLATKLITLYTYSDILIRGSIWTI